MPPIPPFTQALILVCTTVFCLKFFVPVAPLLAMFPLNSGYFKPWQPLTYGLFHGDFLSLLFNMLALWMFGGELELRWGRKRYAALLAASLAGGALLFAVLGLVAPGVLIGSSAAIYALLVVAAMTSPNRTIVPLIPPIPMKMKVFVGIFGAIVLLLGLADGNIGALGHLGGAIGGALTFRYWQGQSPFGGRRRR